MILIGGVYDFISMSHTHRGALINILVLDWMYFNYIFRLQDLLQLYYILLKQLKPARLYIFFFLEWIVVH